MKKRNKIGQQLEENSGGRFLLSNEKGSYILKGWEQKEGEGIGSWGESGPNTSLDEFNYSGEG